MPDRRQYVKVNDCISETVHVNSGVHQGSLLGPLFFLIYVNDLPKDMTEYEAFGYADDFKLVTSVPKTQKNLLKVEDWCNANIMNLSECKGYILPIKQKEGPKL